MFSCVSNIFLFACKNVHFPFEWRTNWLQWRCTVQNRCYVVYSDVSTYRTSNASASITKWVWRMTLVREYSLSLYMAVRMYIGDRRRYKRVKHWITTVHNDGNGTVVCLFTWASCFWLLCSLSVFLIPSLMLILTFSF